MPIRYITVEFLKLRRSLALLLCIAAPACVAALGFVIALDSARPGSWQKFLIANAGLWSFAMLPLAITALSVLIAQIEHGPRTWNHLLTLPGARPWAFVAKGVVMLSCVAAMTFMLFAFSLAAGALSTLMRPDALTGTADPAMLASMLARMAIAATLVSMLQLWVALRFTSFVPPLVFGLAGTLVAIGATGARQGVYFPWLLATNILSLPERATQVLLVGGVGGLIVFATMTIDLSRREA